MGEVLFHPGREDGNCEVDTFRFLVHSVLSGCVYFSYCQHLLLNTRLVCDLKYRAISGLKKNLGNDIFLCMNCTDEDKQLKYH